VLFGVLHHVPGRENRIGLLRGSRRLRIRRPPGVLHLPIDTCVSEKIVPGTTSSPTGIEIDPPDLEPETIS
jgi:hypothetical protein